MEVLHQALGRLASSSITPSALAVPIRCAIRVCPTASAPLINLRGRPKSPSSSDHSRFAGSESERFHTASRPEIRVRNYTFFTLLRRLISLLRTPLGRNCGRYRFKSASTSGSRTSAQSPVSSTTWTSRPLWARSRMASVSSYSPRGESWRRAVNSKISGVNA